MKSKLSLTQSVAVGLDFSKDSLLALEKGAEFACETDATLHVIHVVDEDFFPRECDEAFLNEECVVDKACEALRERVEHLIRWHPAYEIHVVVGDPLTALIETVANLEAGILFLGRRGHRERTVREPGDTARRVSAHARCAVALVDSDAGFEGEVVVACIDLSEGGRETAYGAAELVASGGELHLFHVFSRLEDKAGSHAGLEEGEREVQTQFADEKKGLEDFAQEMRAAFPELKIVAQIEQGNGIPKMISHYLDRVKADLVVMGEEDKELSVNEFLARTSERVNLDCACSVLTYRARKQEVSIPI